MIQELAKYSEAAGQLDEAEEYRKCSEIIKDINAYVNEMMEAGRIDDFPGDISKQVSRNQEE